MRHDPRRKGTLRHAGPDWRKHCFRGVGAESRPVRADCFAVNGLDRLARSFFYLNEKRLESGDQLRRVEDPFLCGLIIQLV